MPLAPKQVRVGAKCLFVCSESQCLFIREQKEDKVKPLDLIGGEVEFGETPLLALIREVEEETGLVMKESDFVYLGESIEDGDNTEWHSHVFVARAPNEMKAKPGIEVVEIMDFHYWNKSADHRPRAIWVHRHIVLLASIGQLLSHFHTLLKLKEMTKQTTEALTMLEGMTIYTDKMLRLMYEVFSPTLRAIALGTDTASSCMDLFSYLRVKNIPDSPHWLQIYGKKILWSEKPIWSYLLREGRSEKDLHNRMRYLGFGLTIGELRGHLAKAEKIGIVVRTGDKYVPG